MGAQSSTLITEFSVTIWAGDKLIVSDCFMAIWSRNVPGFESYPANQRWLGHINNLYNTTFWTMVLQGGMSNTDAEQELKVGYYSSIRSTGHWLDIRVLCLQTRMKFSSSGLESTTITSWRSIKRALYFIARYAPIYIMCFVLSQPVLTFISTVRAGGT